jgi:hypothetical protein
MQKDDAPEVQYGNQPSFFMVSVTTVVPMAM